jgi:hypothetical protein
MGAVPSQRSVAEVLQDIVGNLQQIIRSEFRLAGAELKEKAARAARPATTLVVSAILGLRARFPAFGHRLCSLNRTVCLVGGVDCFRSFDLRFCHFGRYRTQQIETDSTRSRENGGNREGECAMGEKPDEIKQQIDETRENLNENFSELQEKVKSVFDWRAQFDERPMTMLAAAFGGGLLASTLISSGASPRRYYRDKKDPGDLPDESRNAERINVANSSRVNGESGRRYTASKEALMAVVATRLGGVLGEILSGYRDELRRVRQSRPYV